MEVWTRLWSVPCCEAHDALPSTNDRVRELAGQGAAPFTVVIADEQTRGRGRAGRRWESPPGAGLWMSFLLRPDAGVSHALTPILVGLATARAIETLCPALRPEVKWPNDVLIDGRKAGGILCEGVGGEAIVVGVGINVSQGDADFPAALRGRATSLGAAGCEGVSRAALAGAVLREARSLVEPLPDGLDGGLRRELQRRDALAGRTVRADTGQQGRALGVAADGALLIEAEGQVQAIRGGGVRVV